MDNSIIYKWVKIKGMGWEIVQVRGQYFYLFETSTPRNMCHECIEYWGPIVNPPIEVSQRKHISRTLQKEEVTVEKAEISSEKKIYGVFNPSYEIEDFKFVESERQNDCAIVALANIASLSYGKAKVLCFHHGWSSNRGLSFGFLEVILEKLGFEWAERGTFFSCNNGNIPLGVFLIYTKTHVMPMINKGLYNCGDTNHNVINITEIRPLVKVSK